jgi:hypothetical protein
MNVKYARLIEELGLLILNKAKSLKRCILNFKEEDLQVRDIHQGKDI